MHVATFILHERGQVQDKDFCFQIVYIHLAYPCSYRSVIFRERERLGFSAFLGTEDIGVHISRVIITYIDNPQSTGYN